MTSHSMPDNTMRRILVPLDSKVSAQNIIETAVQIAQTMNSHVRVLTIAEDPTHDDGKYPPAVADMPPPEGTIRKRGDDDIARARWETINEIFQTACTRHKCRIVNGTVPLDEPSAGLVSEVGDPPDVISSQGRRSDLIVVGKPTSARLMRSSIRCGAALFETGRPVIVTPSPAAGGIGRRIAIAWNDTPESSRAVAAAMKFIQRAEKVYVLTAESDRTPAKAAQELAEYLAEHGVEAETRVFAKMGDKSLGGKRLLAECAAVKADLLVMGAARMGRFNEEALGPATREVLELAEIPILMAR